MLHFLCNTFCVIENTVYLCSGSLSIRAQLVSPWEKSTAADFLKRYQIGGASTSQKLAESLSEKGWLNVEVGHEGIEYSVGDVFLSHWLERL